MCKHIDLPVGARAHCTFISSQNRWATNLLGNYRVESVLVLGPLSNQFSRAYVVNDRAFQFARSADIRHSCLNSLNISAISSARANENVFFTRARNWIAREKCREKRDKTRIYIFPTFDVSYFVARLLHTFNSVNLRPVNLRPVNLSTLAPHPKHFSMTIM